MKKIEDAYDFMWEKYKQEVMDEFIFNLEYMMSMRKTKTQLEIKMKSPLEQMFFMDWFYKIDKHDEWWSHAREEYNATKDEPVIPKLRTQYKCGKYRIDFAIIRRYCKIAIEMDGFSYHDRDEKQFQYERERQNYLTKKGFTVMRFTWKDMVYDDCEPVEEVMEMIENKCKEYYRGVA